MNDIEVSLEFTYDGCHVIQHVAVNSRMTLSSLAAVLYDCFQMEADQVYYFTIENGTLYGSDECSRLYINDLSDTFTFVPMFFEFDDVKIAMSKREIFDVSRNHPYVTYQEVEESNTYSILEPQYLEIFLKKYNYLPGNPRGLSIDSVISNAYKMKQLIIYNQYNDWIENHFPTIDKRHKHDLKALINMYDCSDADFYKRVKTLSILKLILIKSGPVANKVFFEVFKNHSIRYRDVPREVRAQLSLLLDFGYLRETYECYYITMDIRDMYDTIDIDKWNLYYDTIRAFDMCAKVVVSCYGVLRIDLFTDLMREFFYGFPEARVHAFFNLGEPFMIEYVDIDDKAIFEKGHEENFVKRYMNKMVRYAHFTKEQIEGIYDQTYILSIEEYANIMKHLKEKYPLTPLGEKMVLERVFAAISREETTEEIIRMIDLIIRRSLQRDTKIGGLIEAARLNTPLWKYHGFTRNQVLQSRINI